MTTIDTLAAEYKKQPHELAALADVPQGVDLDAATEKFVRDVVENTDTDGVYRG